MQSFLFINVVVRGREGVGREGEKKLQGVCLFKEQQPKKKR